MPVSPETIRQHFPVFTEPELIDAIAEKGKLMEVPAGTVIMDIGSYVKIMPLVVEGAIKVIREDGDAHELFLYFLYPGQSCAMTLNCCMAHVPSQVRAVAEEDTKLIAIPVDVIDEWMKKYNDWKNFIMQTYSQRFHELLYTIDSIAFQKMDERLLRYLTEKAEAGKSNELNITHQQIAYDLNSSREVISRLLKQLEKIEKIKLGRNKIQLIV